MICSLCVTSGKSLSLRFPILIKNECNNANTIKGLNISLGVGRALISYKRKVQGAVLSFYCYENDIYSIKV